MVIYKSFSSKRRFRINNYSIIPLNFNTGDILTTNLHYIYENKKYRLTLNFLIKKWPETNVNLNDFGRHFLESIIKPRFASIMHTNIKFHKIVFKINAKTPYNLSVNYTYLFPRNIIGTLPGTIDSNKMYRLQIQKVNSKFCNWINLWGVPLELNYLPQQIDPNLSHENSLVKNAMTLNNALSALENLFVLPIEFEKNLSLQFYIIEKQKKWTLDENNAIVACTATGHYLQKTREKKNTSNKTKSKRIYKLKKKS